MSSGRRGLLEPLERAERYRKVRRPVTPWAWGFRWLPWAVQPCGQRLSSACEQREEQQAQLKLRRPADGAMAPLLPVISRRVHLRDRCSRRPIRTKTKRSIVFGNRFASRANERSARVRWRGPKGAISLRHRRRFTFVHRVGKGIPVGEERERQQGRHVVGERWRPC